MNVSSHAVSSATNFASPKLAFPLSFGPFTVNGRLGMGGMGVVLDATTKLGGRVALKILHAGLEGENYEVLRARLAREGRLLRQLNHPGIVHLEDIGEIDGVLYVAMEHITGVTLAQVKKRTSLPPKALVSLAAQLCESLAHMHDVGIVHRDIKPSNILVNRAGQAVIADFGIAWMPEVTGITRAGEIIGSAGYVAPEYFKGKPPSAASDQYALGKLLFELATPGPPPRVADDVPMVVQFAMRTEVDWERFPRDPPWPALEHACIRRMVQPKPERRFPNMRACLEAFVEFDRDVLRRGEASRDLGIPFGVARDESQDLEANTRFLKDFVLDLKLEARSPWAPSPTEGGGDEHGAAIGSSPSRPEILSRPEAEDAPGVESANVEELRVDSRDVESRPYESRGGESPGGGGRPSEEAREPGEDREADADRIESSVDRGPRERFGMPVARSRWRTLVSAFVTLGVAFLAGAGAAGLLVGVLSGVGALDPIRRWSLSPTGASAPELLHRYRFRSSISQGERRIRAGRLMSEARARLGEFHFEQAETLLAECIELADEIDCHAALAAVLGLRGHPAAEAHLRRARHEDPDQ